MAIQWFLLDKLPIRLSISNDRNRRTSMAGCGREGELAPAPVRHSLKPEFSNGCNAALALLSTSGQELPVAGPAELPFN